METTTKTKTTKELKELFSHIGKNKKGNFVARFPFFYTHGKTTKDSVEFVKQRCPSANIIDSGEKWTAFKGGASVANQSHWYVEFNFNVTE